MQHNRIRSLCNQQPSFDDSRVIMHYTIDSLRSSTPQRANPRSHMHAVGVCEAFLDRLYGARSLVSLPPRTPSPVDKITFVYLGPERQESL